MRKHILHRATALLALCAVLLSASGCAAKLPEEQLPTNQQQTRPSAGNQAPTGEITPPATQEGNSQQTQPARPNGEENTQRPTDGEEQRPTQNAELPTQNSNQNQSNQDQRPGNGSNGNQNTGYQNQSGSSQQNQQPTTATEPQEPDPVPTQPNTRPTEPEEDVTEPTTRPTEPEEEDDVTEPTTSPTEPEEEDDVTEPTTRPTEPEEEEPETPTTTPTQPEEEPVTPPAQQVGPDLSTTYEEYWAMTGTEQMLFYYSFANADAFYAWYNDAFDAYKEANPDIEIGSDGSVDIGKLPGQS